MKHTRLLENRTLTDNGSLRGGDYEDRKLCVGTGSFMEAYPRGEP